MEDFKYLNQLMEMNEKHMHMGAFCGSVPSLEGMHKYLSEEVLNSGGWQSDYIAAVTSCLGRFYNTLRGSDCVRAHATPKQRWLYRAMNNVVL